MIKLTCDVDNHDPLEREIENFHDQVRDHADFIIVQSLHCVDTDLLTNFQNNRIDHFSHRPEKKREKIKIKKGINKTERCKKRFFYFFIFIFSMQLQIENIKMRQIIIIIIM